MGYGDLEIKYDSTRIFGIFFILIVVCLYAAVVNNIFDIMSSDNDEEPAVTHYVFSNQEWKELSDKMFTTENKTISKERLILNIILRKHIDIINYTDKVKPIVQVQIFDILFDLNRIGCHYSINLSS